MLRQLTIERGKYSSNLFPNFFFSKVRLSRWNANWGWHNWDKLVYSHQNVQIMAVVDLQSLLIVAVFKWLPYGILDVISIKVISVAMLKSNNRDFLTSKHLAKNLHSSWCDTEFKGERIECTLEEEKIEMSSRL